MRHFLANLCNLLLQLRKTSTQIFKHRAVLHFFAHAELSGIAGSAFFILCNFSVKPVFLGICQHFDKRRFAAAVAPNQRAMLPLLNGKRYIAI